MVERNGRDRAIIRGDETERNRIIKRVSLFYIYFVPDSHQKKNLDPRNIAAEKPLTSQHRRSRSRSSSPHKSSLRSRSTDQKVCVIRATNKNDEDDINDTTSTTMTQTMTTSTMTTSTMTTLTTTTLTMTTSRTTSTTMRSMKMTSTTTSTTKLQLVDTNLVFKLP